MSLEPVLQSEVSQKEKHQYSILTPIYGMHYICGMHYIYGIYMWNLERQ